MWGRPSFSVRLVAHQITRWTCLMEGVASLSDSVHCAATGRKMVGCWQGAAGLILPQLEYRRAKWCLHTPPDLNDRFPSRLLVLRSTGWRMSWRRPDGSRLARRRRQTAAAQPVSAPRSWRRRMRRSSGRWRRCGRRYVAEKQTGKFTSLHKVSGKRCRCC